MSTQMVISTFTEDTDMKDVFAVVDQEQRRVAELVAEGRLGSIHLSLTRGTVFIETFAPNENNALATVGSLPMARWWDLDVFPVAAPGGEAA